MQIVTITLTRDQETRLKEIISIYPGLNFTLIINQALEEWLRGQQSFNLRRDCFITNASNGFGPTYKLDKD